MKLARSLSEMYLIVTFPLVWMQSTTLLAPKGAWSDESDKLQTNCWFVSREEGVGVSVVGNFAANRVRDDTDSVCAQDTCRCRTVLTVESRGVDE